MDKTLLQEKLEHQHGKPVEEILRETLGSHRGQKGLPILTAADLGISDGTLYWWCRELGINIDDYRRPPTAPEDEDGQRAPAKGPTHG